MKRKIAVFVLALIMAYVSVACAVGQTSGTTTTPTTPSGTTAKSSGGVFKIVTYQPLTGVNANTGIAAKEAIDLAVKYINKNGGFNGAMGQVVHYDTTTSVEEAVKIAQKIIQTMPDVNAVLMSASSNEIAATIKFLNEAKIYNLGLGTSAVWMQDPSMVWTFRACTNNDRTLPQGVKMLKETFKYKTVATFNSTDEGSKNTTVTFTKLCEEAGIKVTTHQECDSEATLFPGQVNQIIATNPDVVFMCGFGTQPALMAQQLRFGGYKGLILSKDTMWKDMIDIAGDTGDGVFAVYPYIAYVDINDCQIPIMREFLEKYKAEYGYLPKVEGAYRGWDTMMTIWEASKIAGSNDATALRDATAKVKMPGLGGELDFTKGDREGYSEFNAFICIDRKNVLFSDWLANDGYKKFLTKNGRDR